MIRQRCSRLAIALWIAPCLALAAGEPVSIPKVWSARERSVAAQVTENGLAADIRFLSSDLLEGRAPGSRGDAVAMEYIATEYEKLGLEPAGDNGTYLQNFSLVGLKSELLSPPIIRGASGSTLVLQVPSDAIVAPGAQSTTLGVRDAEVLFVGYGITAPEQDWDDFKKVDVRGRVLLVMNNDPAEAPALFGGKTRLYYGRWTYKFEEAARRGAAGVIIIHTTPSAGYPWQVVQSSWNGEAFELPAVPSEPRLQVKMWTTEDASRKLVALGGYNLDELRLRAERRDFHPVKLGVKLTVALQTKLRQIATANVLGKLPGQDAKLGREIVVYSAHHDHLGIREAKNGDAIYNGALDNASGVAAMLAAARALAAAKPAPKRSVLFAAVAAEESGLLGSEFFCAHPIVPAGRIAANLNIDGVNIWGRTRDVTFIGLGKSSLDETVSTGATQQGRIVRADQFPDRGHFYRSDQLNFARIGVPAVYLDSGTDFLGHPPAWGRERIEEYERQRYHQPSDELFPSWQFAGAVDDIRLLSIIGLRIADGLHLPTWTAGDEFEKARTEALQKN